LSDPRGMLTRLVLGALLSLCLSATLWADLQAFVATDVVELKDGKKIQCLILMESSRGVLVVMPDPEQGEDAYRQQFIPKSQIKHMVRGPRQGGTKAFQTDTELARKVVQGSGFQPETTSRTQPAEPITPTGPIAPATPPVTAKPAPVPAGGKGALPAKDLTEAYLQRFPALEEASQMLGGRTILAKSIESTLADPAARQEAERLLDMFLQTAEAKAAPRRKMPVKRKKAKPAPRTPKRMPAAKRK